jgi:hypothetical protein
MIIILLIAGSIIISTRKIVAIDSKHRQEVDCWRALRNLEHG